MSDLIVNRADRRPQPPRPEPPPSLAVLFRDFCAAHMEKHDEDAARLSAELERNGRLQAVGGLSHLIALRPREKNRGGHQVPRPRPDLIPRAWCGGCRARRPPARATGETQRKGSKSLIALGTTPARRDHIYHELDLVVTTG